MDLTVRPAPAGGLSKAEAAERHRRQGPNALPPPPRPNLVVLLLAQLTHFFAVMLWIAAGLALVAGMAPSRWLSPSWSEWSPSQCSPRSAGRRPRA
ncbi:cation-transporting P-type ATPase [Nocardia cyriacigeorgica]|uniref:cation-transporting P-type ATPase n=1 Tax=Nocardia cyriacigeorgica TaxID=135487 RepID=UPI0021144730